MPSTCRLRCGGKQTVAPSRPRAAHLRPAAPCATAPCRCHGVTECGHRGHRWTGVPARGAAPACGHRGNGADSGNNLQRVVAAHRHVQPPLQDKARDRGCAGRLRFKAGVVRGQWADGAPFGARRFISQDTHAKLRTQGSGGTHGQPNVVGGRRPGGSYRNPGAHADECHLRIPASLTIRSGWH